METNYLLGQSDKLFEILKWITPIILFSLGYLVNEWIAFNKRKKDLRVLKSLILTQLQQLYEQVNEQITHNTDCIKRLGTFENNDVRLNRHYGYNIDRIRQIPFKDTFQILVNGPLKKNRKRDYYINRFNKLFRLIDYYYAGISSSYLDNDMTIKNLNDTLEKWNLSHAQTTNLKNLLVTTINAKQLPPDSDQFVAKYAEIVHQFGLKFGKNVQNLEIGFNELVIPLSELTKKHSGDPRSAYLMGILQESRHAFLETKSQRQNSSAGLTQLNDALIKFNPEFKKIIDELENEA
jgi:hypothetical protein